MIKRYKFLLFVLIMHSCLILEHSWHHTVCFITMITFDKHFILIHYYLYWSAINTKKISNISNFSDTGHWRESWVRADFSGGVIWCGHPHLLHHPTAAHREMGTYPGWIAQLRGFDY